MTSLGDMDGDVHGDCESVTPTIFPSLAQISLCYLGVGVPRGINCALGVWQVTSDKLPIVAQRFHSYALLIRRAYPVVFIAARSRMSSASHVFRPCWIYVQQGEHASHTSLMQLSVSCVASETRNAVFNSAQLQTPHGTTPTKLKQPVFLVNNYLNSISSAGHERIRSSHRGSHFGRANAVNGIEAGAGDLDKKGTVSGPEKEDEDEDDDLLTDDDELDLDEFEEEDSDELGKVQIHEFQRLGTNQSNP